MNLLSLIVIFLALAICGAIAYIAWDLTDERHDQPDRDGPDSNGPDRNGKEGEDGKRTSPSGPGTD